MSKQTICAAAFIYERVAAKIEVEGVGPTLSQGICCRDQAGALIAEIPDICLDPERIDHLVGCMNSCGLCHSHMKDVVEDFIALL